jgi:hypothetical protein
MYYQFSMTSIRDQYNANCLSTFLCRLERELRRGTEVRTILLDFEFQGFSTYNCEFVLSWLRATTTLRNV